VPLHFFGSKSTICRFDERSCDGQYSLVSFLFAVLLQAPRRSDVNSLLQTLHWLPVEQRINYKLAVLTFQTQQTSSPQYLN